MNNCGDFVHMHVAERGVLRKMMKIAKKKVMILFLAQICFLYWLNPFVIVLASFLQRNYHVREKILMLIDNWQEAFGGPGSRHPQYYAAFHSLLVSFAKKCNLHKSFLGQVRKLAKNLMQQCYFHMHVYVRACVVSIIEHVR